MKPPEPSPVASGTVRPRTAWTATAASAAVPPFFRMAQPAALAKAFDVDTMYFFAYTALSPVRYPDAASGSAGSPGTLDPTTTALPSLCRTSQLVSAACACIGV